MPDLIVIASDHARDHLIERMRGVVGGDQPIRVRRYLSEIPCSVHGGEPIRWTITGYCTECYGDQSPGQWLGRGARR